MKSHLNSNTIFPRIFFEVSTLRKFLKNASKIKSMCDFEKIMYSIARSPSPMQVKNFFSFDKLTENFTVQHVFDRENFVRSIEYLDKSAGDYWVHIKLLLIMSS